MTNEWQPIETAPKGKLIIVWRPYREVFTAELSSYGWYVLDEGGGEFLRATDEPTRWMHFPPPPKPVD